MVMKTGDGRSMHFIIESWIYMRTKTTLPQIGIKRAMAWACISENLTPLVGCALCHAQIVIGRSTSLSTLETREWISPQEYPTAQDSMQVQAQVVFTARTKMIRMDSERIPRIGLSRPIRAHTSGDFQIDDIVLLRMKVGIGKEEQCCG